jgi:putative transposase
VRVLSLIDSFTRRSLALEVNASFPSRRVTRVLEAAIRYGKPLMICCDNDPEIS